LQNKRFQNYNIQQNQGDRFLCFIFLAFTLKPKLKSLKKMKEILYEEPEIMAESSAVFVDFPWLMGEPGGSCLANLCK
jgi:hypothetical protein